MTTKWPQKNWLQEKKRNVIGTDGYLNNNHREAEIGLT